MKNYYEILEVSENASKEVIDKAYRVLTIKYHPDVQPINKRASSENKMKEITLAYEVLSNDEKRKEYDFMIGLNNNANYYNEYNNLQNEQVKMKQELNKLKMENKEYEKKQSILEKNAIIRSINPVKYFNIIGSTIYNASKKPAEERKKDIKAFIITIIIMGLIIIAFIKIPFLKKLLKF